MFDLEDDAKRGNLLVQELAHSEIAGLASPAGRNMIEVVLKSGWEFKVPVGEHGRIKKAWMEYLASK